MFSRFSHRCVSLICASALVMPLPLLAQTSTTVTGDNTSPAPVIMSAPKSTLAVVDVATVSTISKPVVASRAWIVVDAVTGQTIASHNPSQEVEPASLTKIMTVYLTFEALKENRITTDQQVNISEKAWRTPGSRMFIEPRKPVTVEELLQGVVVQSGNDASVAIAELLAGTEAAFAQRMTEKAIELGMNDTTFKNSNGLPDPEHTTTVQDLAIMAQRMISDHPEKYKMYAGREFTYNKIKQINRNRLLWADPSVDGMKTGYTTAAGYCLIATAQRGERRIISVLVGAESEATRAEESLKLLNWSFQNFDSVKLFDANKPAIQARVWEGTTELAALGSPLPILVTIPRGKTGDVLVTAQRPDPLLAPLSQGQRVGQMTLSLDGQPLRVLPLDVLVPVERAGFFGRALDQFKLWLQ
jgi:D-alanyl-D-alanine carboxypeptidase (penicillin-binding protein 5/6)